MSKQTTKEGTYMSNQNYITDLLELKDENIYFYNNLKNFILIYNNLWSLCIIKNKIF